MTIKYIITQINDNIIYSKYNNNGCLSLNIVDKSSLVGNIYIGRVENVVKNISSAFVEIENKIKAITSLKIIRIIYFLIQRIIKLSTSVMKAFSTGKQ